MRNLDDLIDHGLTVAFQPIVRLVNADVVGYEALGRILSPPPWLVALGGGPAPLLEVAVREGKLMALDRKWRELAIRHVARAHGGDATAFFLNVDPRILDDPGFTSGFTRGLLADHGLSPTRFVLEITEVGAPRDSEMLLRVVEHYATQGLRIALDDVGAGYASLVALLKVRPHVLKLDKEIVRGIDRDPVRTNLVRALADFGRRSNVRVVAEGIETEGELATLMSVGVPWGQGFLLGRPSAVVEPLAEDVKRLLRQVSDRTDRARFRSTRSLGVGELEVAHPSISPMMTCEDMDTLFRRDPTRNGYPVVDDAGHAIGLVVRERFMNQTSGRFGFALHAKRPVLELMDRHPLIVDESVSVFQVSQLATGRPHDTVQDPVLVERDGKYVGIVTTQALLATVTELEIQHATYASPLTGLPGNVVIEREIRRGLDLASEGRDATVVYVDIDHFKAFNDVYGFTAGDDVIRLVAQVLTQHFAVPMFDDAFVGHVGGDDFVAVVTGNGSVDEACARVGADFDARVRNNYAPLDLQRGGIVTRDRRGNEAFFPLATLSMAVVVPKDLAVSEVHEVARVAAELKRRAKTAADESGPVSRFVRNRRGPARD